MIKRALVLMTMTTFMGVSPAAFAQGEVKSELVDMEGMTIDGVFKKPDVMKSNAKNKAKFKRLLRLKKSMLPAVVKTSEEQALK